LHKENREAEERADQKKLCPDLSDILDKSLKEMDGVNAY